MLRSSKRDLHKRPPLWPLRFANQAHVCFTRKPVPLARITGDAGANHVFPYSRPAAIARHDVIEIEFAAVELVAAVLTGVLVALENIVARKFYFLFRQPIEHEQHNHTRDADLERNGRNHFMIGCVRGQIAPAFEVVRRKVVRVIRRNNLGVPCIHERKGAASRANVHRLPESVEYQNLTVQQGVQVCRPNRVIARLLRTSA
jgi:hypothetical protein